MKKRFLFLVFSLILTLSFVSAAQKIVISSVVLPISINKVIIDNNVISVLVESKNLNKEYIMFDVKSQDGTTKRYFSSPKLLNSYEATYFDIPLEVSNPTYLYATPYHSSGSTITLYEFSKEIYTFTGGEYKTITTSAATAVTPGQSYSTLTTTSNANTNTDTKVLYVKGIQKIQDNNIEYLHNDYLGSTRRMSDSVSGEQVLSSDYYYFGSPLKTYGYNNGYLSSVKKAFTSKEQDNSGLYYFGARYYNPLVGRFVSVDPEYDPLFSPYDYAKNNPIRFVDRTGKRPESSVGSLRAFHIGASAALPAISSILRGDSIKGIVKSAFVGGAAGAVSFESKRFVGRNPGSDVGFLAASQVANVANSVRANIMQGKGPTEKITLTYLAADINIKGGKIKPTLNLARVAEIAGSALISGNKLDASTTLTSGVAHYTRSDGAIKFSGDTELPDLPTPFGGAISYDSSRNYPPSNEILGHARVHNLDFKESSTVFGEGVQVFGTDEDNDLFGVPISDPRIYANAAITGWAAPFAINTIATGSPSILRFHASDLFYSERNANTLSGTK